MPDEVELEFAQRRIEAAGSVVARERDPAVGPVDRVRALDGQRLGDRAHVGEDQFDVIIEPRAHELRQVEAGVRELLELRAGERDATHSRRHVDNSTHGELAEDKGMGDEVALRHGPSRWGVRWRCLEVLPWA